VKQQEIIEAIRRGAAADLAAVRAAPEPPRWRTRDHAEWTIKAENAADNVIDLATARWLGLDRLGQSDTTMVSRALRAGEDRGLWIRCGSTRRTWGLKLLDAHGGTDG